VKLEVMDPIPAWKKKLISQKKEDSKSPEVLVINGKVYMQVGTEEESEKDVRQTGARGGIETNASSVSTWQTIAPPTLANSLGTDGNQRSQNSWSLGRSNTFSNGANGNTEATNNGFLGKNVRVREWTPKSKFEEENIEQSQAFNGWSSEVSENKSESGPENMMAKQVAIVDALKQKLELKKHGNVMGQTSSESGVVLRKNVFEQFGKSNGTKKEPNSPSSKQETSVADMVQIGSKSVSNAKVNVGTYDHSREQYIMQFSEKTRPISEVSPIKSQLEGIYSRDTTGVSSKAKPPAEVDVVFTSKEEEEEDKAKKSAAVKAMEKAFLKKKVAVTQSSEIEEVKQTYKTPTPTTRQSIKRKEENSSSVEYTNVTSNKSSQPSIRIVEFGTSGTDYNTITKKIN